MPTARQIGVACEALVLADLMKRGLEVTQPFIDNGDDLHVRTSKGWLSVQVKARDRRMKVWRVSGSNRNIRSRLLALVDIDTHEIRYFAAAQVPRELK